MPGANFKDHFSADSDGYRKFRPGYPPGLFTWLAGLAPDQGVAWDCATGSGQAARMLASHFRLVLASDASTSQLRQASGPENLQFLAAYAEAPPFRQGSVALLTVAQALHWFDLERFYREAQGVLKTGGIIAVWTYNLLRIEPGINRVIKRLYNDILEASWPPERRLVEENYRTIPFPFAEIEAPKFNMGVEWRIADLLGYLSTWSAVLRYRKDTGRDPLDLVRADLEAAWGAEEPVREITWPLVLRVGINL